MKIDNKIRNEKLQYHINREAVKASALPTSKFEKQQYPTGKQILPSDQRRVIGQAKFANTP